MRIVCCLSVLLCLLPAAPLSACPADFNADLQVDGKDLAHLLTVWGPVEPGRPEDLNADGRVDWADRALLFSAWGLCRHSVGDPEAPFYEEQTIARWDVVPFQEVEPGFEVGVIAFHAGGVAGVRFHFEDRVVWVEEASLNPRTGVVEHWTAIEEGDDADEDGAIEIRAVAWPRIGRPRVLAGPLRADTVAEPGEHEMVLFTPTPKPRVRTLAPHESLGDLIHRSRSGDTIELLDGVHQIDGMAAPPEGIDTSWLTIRPAPGAEVIVLERGGDRDNLGVKGRVRWRGTATDGTGSLRFERHFTGQYYPHTDDFVWFSDGVAFSDSVEGWDAQWEVRPGLVHPRGRYYWTDVRIQHVDYGPVGSSNILVRGCDLDHIGGEGFTGARMVVNSTIDFLENRNVGNPFHADVFQPSTPDESNGVFYGVSGANLFAQFFFLSGEGPYENLAFVDIHLDTKDGRNPGSGRPWTDHNRSSLYGVNRHVIFDNVAADHPINLHDDRGPDASENFVARSVVFRDCTLHPKTYVRLKGQAPQGVMVENIQPWRPRGDTTSACIADLDADGVVGPADLEYVRARLGTDDRSADLNLDGGVDEQDVELVIQAWGDCG